MAIHSTNRTHGFSIAHEPDSRFGMIGGDVGVREPVAVAGPRFPVVCVCCSRVRSSMLSVCLSGVLTLVQKLPIVSLSCSSPCITTSRPVHQVVPRSTMTLHKITILQWHLESDLPGLIIQRISYSNKALRYSTGP